MIALVMLASAIHLHDAFPSNYNFACLKNLAHLENEKRERKKQTRISIVFKRWNILIFLLFCDWTIYLFASLNIVKRNNLWLFRSLIKWDDILYRTANLGKKVLWKVLRLPFIIYEYNNFLRWFYIRKFNY